VPAAKDEIKAGRFKVPVTNRNKIYWPKEKYTKIELIEYYRSVSKFILAHLRYRPLSLKRNPNGILDKGFYHKDAGENAPSYVSVFPVKSESTGKIVNYIVCNNEATLIYVANLGCIEINPWNSTIKKTAYPTWMVIDIDPSDKNTFQQVTEVALVTKSVLDKEKVSCYCKTSGSSGMHIYVPLNNRYPGQRVKEFAHKVALQVQAQLPGTTSLERSLKKRGDKIYIDYLQNNIGQTLASVYSVRPVPGAWASAPLQWKEVNKYLHPSMFTMKNLAARVQRKGDLFLPVLKETNVIS
jgi:bifunctional non-homologous end joining protein LigD